MSSKIGEVTDVLIEEAKEAVEDALDTVLFHHFGKKLYSELPKAKQAMWDDLVDQLRAEVL